MLFDRLLYGYRCCEGEDSGDGGGGVGSDTGGEGEDSGDGGGGVGSDTGGGDSGESGDSGSFDNIGGSGTNSSNPAELISNEEILKRGRELAIAGVPLQIGNLFDAINRLRAQAKGSSAEIFPQVIGQLSTIRRTLADASSAVSRRLGYAGGGQATRGRQVALGQAANQYGNLISQGQQAAFANLLNNLGGFQPTLSGSARPPNVNVQTAPNDLTNVGRSLAGFAGVYRTFRDGKESADANNAASTIAGFRNNADANNAASTIAGFRNNPDIYNQVFGPQSVG